MKQNCVSSVKYLCVLKSKIIIKQSYTNFRKIHYTKCKYLKHTCIFRILTLMAMSCSAAAYWGSNKALTTALSGAEIPYSHPRPGYTGNAFSLMALSIQGHTVAHSSCGAVCTPLMMNLKWRACSQRTADTTNSHISSTPSLNWRLTASSFHSGRKLLHCLLPFNFSRCLRSGVINSEGHFKSSHFHVFA